MIRRHKYILVFSIIYWFIAFSGIALFSVSFQKVPLGHYGLKTNYFSPQIDPNYYLQGLYNTGVGYYFVLFPSTKQYVTDKTLTIINKNLERVNVTYSLIYRIDPNKIYSLYQKYGDSYPTTIISSVNSIISQVFFTLSQSQTRVTAQSSIVTSLRSPTNKVSLLLNNSIIIQGLFINEVAFDDSIEALYQQSVLISDTYEQSYQTTELDYQKARIQSNGILQTIDSLKYQVEFYLGRNYQNQLATVISTDQAKLEDRQAAMSYAYLFRRIWSYYNNTRIVFG